MASADNVEGFYRNASYEPETILVQTTEDALLEDYEEKSDVVAERKVDSDRRFLYVGFDEYDQKLRSDCEAS